jgi:hypothetical protein
MAGRTRFSGPHHPMALRPLKGPSRRLRPIRPALDRTRATTRTGTNLTGLAPTSGASPPRRVPRRIRLGGVARLRDAPRGTCENFLHGFKGTPSGRASRPACGPGHSAEARGSSGELRDGTGILADARAGERGCCPTWGRQPAPPFRLESLRAGHCRRSARPAPRRPPVPAVTPPR